jgi:hypothetical protein
MMKKELCITEKEAKIISDALSDYITTKRLDGEKNPNCDKYFLGFECGKIDCLSRRILELFEE